MSRVLESMVRTRPVTRASVLAESLGALDEEGDANAVEERMMRVAAIPGFDSIIDFPRDIYSHIS